MDVEIRPAPRRACLDLFDFTGLHPCQSIWDTEEVGLIASASASADILYYLHFRTADGRAWRVLLGEWPMQAAEDVRKRATLLKRVLRDANDYPFSLEELAQRWTALEQQVASAGTHDTMTGEQYLTNYFVVDDIGVNRFHDQRFGEADRTSLRGSFAALLALPLTEIDATQVLRWRLQALKDAHKSITQQVELLHRMLSHATARGFLRRDPLSTFDAIYPLEEPDEPALTPPARRPRRRHLSSAPDVFRDVETRSSSYYTRRMTVREFIDLSWPTRRPARNAVRKPRQWFDQILERERSFASAPRQPMLPHALLLRAYGPQRAVHRSGKRGM